YKTSSLVVLRNSLELKEQLAYYHSWKKWSMCSTLASVPQKAKSNSRLIVRGCGLELDGHTFLIDLIPFGHSVFNVTVGMDWLSKLKAKIVCFEKIIQILLSNREILEIHGERPEGNLKQLKTMKVKEPKFEDIPVVRNFPSMFPEDLPGLPSFRRI
ncbi:hypothetical protein Tco_1398542, partial [Tanacetum coccineum]